MTFSYPAAEAPERPPLTPRETEILAFERLHWRYSGSKERAIRERLDLSPIGYYQMLNALLDKPAALAADPLLVNRLRRLRDRHAIRRTSRSS